MSAFHANIMGSSSHAWEDINTRSRFQKTQGCARQACKFEMGCICAPIDYHALYSHRGLGMCMPVPTQRLELAKNSKSSNTSNAYAAGRCAPIRNVSPNPGPHGQGCNWLREKAIRWEPKSYCVVHVCHVEYCSLGLSQFFFSMLPLDVSHRPTPVAHMIVLPL